MFFKWYFSNKPFATYVKFNWIANCTITQVWLASSVYIHLPICGSGTGLTVVGAAVVVVVGSVGAAVVVVVGTVGAPVVVVVGSVGAAGVVVFGNIGAKVVEVVASVGGDAVDEEATGTSGTFWAKERKKKRWLWFIKR